jgi:hypothetical protein
MNDNTDKNSKATQRTWVSPKFERQALKDALATPNGTGTDGGGPYS